MIPHMIAFDTVEELDAFLNSLGVPCQAEELKEENKQDLTGGKVNYYTIKVDPLNKPAYTAECGDIIDALGLTFNEANIFKEIWRSANARKGNGKPGNTVERGAEKILHYATRIHRRAVRPVITVNKTY